MIAGTLATLPGLLHRQAVNKPALLIVGEVAAFARGHAWFGELVEADTAGAAQDCASAAVA